MSTGDGNDINGPAPPTTASRFSSSGTPDRIGPYRLLEQLGAGGMGEVYLAEQMEPVRRRVALKVIKLGMDTREVSARFEAERQALAVMDHPCIAKVLDAGATEAGRPYFVMELVRGVPITEYCDTHKLSVRERVELFVLVCHGVQHAHQKGVIHRDLKPSNVLVAVQDDHLVPKIIDFGIAKAVGQSLTERTLHTAYGQLLGTPEYMSPEQAEASGLDVDTRTDIYSLGVMLYELLVGALPFDSSALGRAEFVAQYILREKEPPTPTQRLHSLGDGAQEIARRRRADPAGLLKQLAGDLGWIVMKAMEKDRTRRYDTANGLAHDLLRHLRHEPVLARAPSREYLLRKFVRRHRAGVALGAGLAALLIGFATSVTVQARRLEQARNIAAARQAQAEDLIGFMVGDLSKKLVPIGRLELLDEVGKRALTYFAAVPESELSDEELFRRSEALRQIGEVRQRRGDLVAALAAYEQSLRPASDLARRGPSNGKWQLGLAWSHFWIGYINLEQGHLDGALRRFEAYRDITEHLVARDSANLEYQSELSMARNNIARVQETKGDIAGALHTYEATLAVRTRIAARDPSNAVWQQSGVWTHLRIGVTQTRLGDFTRAEENFRMATALSQQVLTRDSTNAVSRRDIALAHAFLARVSEARGTLDAALAHNGEAQAIFARLTAQDPTNDLWQRDVLGGELTVSRLLLGKGSASASVDRLRGIRPRIEQRMARDLNDPAWQLLHVEMLRLLAAALVADGRPSEALPLARAAVALIDSVAASRRAEREPRIARSPAYITLGEALARAGQPDQARLAWTEAASILEPEARIGGDIVLLATRAMALLHLDRHDDATPMVADLTRRGYREPTFMRLAQRKNAMR